MQSKRISKADHIERMGERAARRHKESLQPHYMSVPNAREIARLQAARRKNGVGRPPRINLARIELQKARLIRSANEGRV